MDKNEDFKYQNFYNYIIKVLAIAKVGILFSDENKEAENFKEIEKLSTEMLSKINNVKFNKINYFSRDVYPTPSVSCSCTIFNKDESKVLLLKECSDDGFWFPTGWCDLFDTPKEAVENICFQKLGVQLKNLEFKGIISRPLNHEIDNFVSSVPEYRLIFKAEAILEKNIEEKQNRKFEADWFKIDELPTLSKKYSVYEWNKTIKACLNDTIILD